MNVQAELRARKLKGEHKQLIEERASASALRADLNDPQGRAENLRLLQKLRSKIPDG